jgi:ribosomal protein L7/L12
VRRVVPPAVTKPPFLVPMPAALGKGPFEVRLLSYPRDKKISVVKVYREVAGCGLAEAKTWSEQAPPLVVVTGIDKHGVEGVRNKFADLGAIEVRERASP